MKRRGFFGGLAGFAGALGLLKSGVFEAEIEETPVETLVEPEPMEGYVIIQTNGLVAMHTTAYPEPTYIQIPTGKKVGVGDMVSLHPKTGQLRKARRKDDQIIGVVAEPWFTR